MKFSELITKPVISIYDTNIEGNIITALFSDNMKKIQAFIVESNNINDAIDEYTLNIKDIYNIGQDAIMIKNNYKLSCNCINEQTFNPINYIIYTTNGTKLGKVDDLILDKNFNVIKFICNEKEIDASTIANINHNIILVNTKDYNIKIAKFKPKVQNIEKSSMQNEGSQVAIIMPINEKTNDEDKEEFKNAEQANINYNIPRFVSQSINLLGKTITQNIITQNGEMIAKKGNIITTNTINQASMHQKLRELTFYAK